METYHSLFFANSANMKAAVANESVDLIVTSPAYPMIKMWDDLYGGFNPEIQKALQNNKGDLAFELQHKELDKTWAECARVLKKGGMAVVNIGDAVRSAGGDFRLYSNRCRISKAFEKLGFKPLPVVLWRKPANSPNKFMGSGVLPAGAYVTLEHEYLLVFRKGAKRLFATKSEKRLRAKSSYFWEERNKWFSDLWLDVRGASQNTNGGAGRSRSAAFPLELAFRLVCMFSVQGDVVLDPFSGTGTTALAALANGRNSIGFEIDKSFLELVAKRLKSSMAELNERNLNRLSSHIQWAKEFMAQKGHIKHANAFYGFPVMTKQETEIRLPFLKSCRLRDRGQLKPDEKALCQGRALKDGSVLSLSADMLAIGRHCFIDTIRPAKALRAKRQKKEPNRGAIQLSL